MGQWHNIIIDDLVSIYKQRKGSTRTSETLNLIKVKCMFQIAEDFTAKPVDKEYWVPLVQKAFAKFFGSYYKINGGVTPTALYNLTGGLVLNIENYTGRCESNLSTKRMLIESLINYY